MTDTYTQYSNETSDETVELLSKLRDLLPTAFLDGELDKSALLDALGLGENKTPAFSFTWPGIEIARENARTSTTATLVPDVAGSVNWQDAKDVLIEGDNLQVLKLLKNGYGRKVKLIYIDPPYNTGDTFTYHDDFAVPESQYLRETGQVDDQGNAMTSRIETGGRKHSPWLTMMFPRFVLARHLLRRDGVILVSIDNNEVHHLRLLLDATFGAENFVDMMTWQGGRKGDAKTTGGGQDYILVYARDKGHLKNLDVRWRERKTGLEDVYAKETELFAEYGSDYESAKKALRKWYRELPDGNLAKQHLHFNQVDEGGVWTSGDASSPNKRENLIYEFRGYQSPTNGWRYEKKVMEKLADSDRLLYPDSEDGRVRIKRYLKDQENWAPPSVFYKERGAAQTALNDLMGGEIFAFPKDIGVLGRLVHAITDNGDLVLDFFAGSGSTGHAIWEQNPKDGKVRHWILVQAPERPDTTEETGKKAIAAGYKTIFDITAERLRRVAESISKKAEDKQLPGFRVFRTCPTNLIVEKPIVATHDLTGQMYLDQVLSHASGSPVVEGAKPEAIAWEIALKSTDTRLDASMTTHQIDDVAVYEFTPVDGESKSGRLLISLDNFTLATADKLGLTDNDTLIIRDDKVEDSVTLTLAPRLRSKLILLERVPREVSL